MGCEADDYVGSYLHSPYIFIAWRMTLTSTFWWYRAHWATDCYKAVVWWCVDRQLATVEGRIWGSWELLTGSKRWRGMYKELWLRRPGLKCHSSTRKRKKKNAITEWRW
jgi:hypothetical protein